MQNYLQSVRLGKKAAKRVLLILAVTLVTAVTIAVKMDVFTLDEYYLYGRESINRLPAENLQNEEKTKVETEKSNSKMNNYEPKNAKTPVSEHNNAVLEGMCDEKVRVLTSSGQIKQMPLEEYIAECVFGEMPLAFDTQALMAQSVAVRSFTVRQMTVGMSKHKNADVCTNPACCQNYVSTEILSDAEKKRLTDAVNATKGMIMVYDGVPIEAVYHASSGSKTLDSEDVWGGKVEYLRSVKSPDGEEAISVSGMGHRVGMSQHGANLLAKEGKNYIEILKYYYNGISFDFLS